MRKYNSEVPTIDEQFGPQLLTLDEWKESLTMGCYNEYDGDAHWMKDGLYSDDSAFNTEPLDATGVIFFAA